MHEQKGNNVYKRASPNANLACKHINHIMSSTKKVSFFIDELVESEKEYENVDLHQLQSEKMEPIAPSLGSPTVDTKSLDIKLSTLPDPSTFPEPLCYRIDVSETEKRRLDGIAGNRRKCSSPLSQDSSSFSNFWKKRMERIKYAAQCFGHR